jgi:uncharacterized protein YodC (DUF2158 family)
LSKSYVLSKYGTLDELNRVWNIGFASVEDIVYPIPKPEDKLRYWLDFIEWYYESETDFARKTIGIIRQYCSEQEIQVKIGYDQEDLRFGNDSTGGPRMACEKGIIVRSMHGSLLCFWYKRISTACRYYNVEYLTESPAIVERG